MFSTIALCIVALYLFIQSSVVTTQGKMLASIVWKVIPNVLAITTVLIAFKVI